MRFTAILGAVLLGTLSSPRLAFAQLHGDVSAQAGVMHRFLSDRGGGSNAGFGPVGQLTGHVALLPLVHVGGYFGHDLSPLPDAGDGGVRDITFGGLRAKVFLPWIRGRARLWGFAGIGYAGVYSRSYHVTVDVPDGLGGNVAKPARVEGAGGGFVDVPVGFGASYKLYGPWELTGELAGRFGFAHHGSVYEAPGPRLTVADGTNQNASPAGLDRFALGLTLGVLFRL